MTTSSVRAAASAALIAAFSIYLYFGARLMTTTATYEAQYLPADEFYRVFRDFKKHLVEKGPDLFVEQVKANSFQAKSLKWLSIGSGYGDMELKIIELLGSEQPSLEIRLLECYEPGYEQFQHLSKTDFGLSTKLNYAPFTAVTDLDDEKYDIITMFHVHYYWTTPEERLLVMDNLLRHLSPGGIMYILVLEKGYELQVNLRSETLAKLSFAEPRFYRSLKIYGSDLAEKEISLVSKSLEDVTSHLPYNYTVTIDIKLSQLAHVGSVASNVLSYILSVDFNALHADVKDFIINWIVTHCPQVDEGTYQIRQSVSALMYSRGKPSV